jgi:hypothetical protein
VESSVRYGYNKPFFTLQNNRLNLENVPVQKGYEPPIDHDKPYVYNDFHPLLSRFHLYNLITQRAIPNILNFTYHFFQHNEFPPDDNQIQQKFDKQIKLISEINAIAISKKSRFHTIFLITGNTSDIDKNRITAIYNQTRNAGISSSTLTSKNIPSTDLWHDGHFSPYGQKMLAQHVYAVINKDFNSP